MGAAEGLLGGYLLASGSSFMLRVGDVAAVVAGYLVRLADWWLGPCFCEGLTDFLKLSSHSWEALCRLSGMQH